MDKIICVGKNYLEHARELGDPIPERPVLFLKPPSTVTYVDPKAHFVRVTLPKDRGEVHPECEIVVRLGSNCEIDAVTLGLDMTLRDIQKGLKKEGHPWELSKVFPQSAVLGPWIEWTQFQNYLEIPFTFSVNSSVRQQGRGNEMRFSPQECLSYAKDHFEICPGDLFFTGTPAGISSIQPGQIAEIKWENRLYYQTLFN